MSRHELLLQKQIVELIISRGGMARICTQTPYTTVGDPDIYGSYRGRCLRFEAKVDREQPTAIQKLKLKEWTHAGALACVVRSEAQVNSILDAIDRDEP